jgi:hypothetical protein
VKSYDNAFLDWDLAQESALTFAEESNPECDEGAEPGLGKEAGRASSLNRGDWSRRQRATYASLTLHHYFYRVVSAHFCRSVARGSLS